LARKDGVMLFIASTFTGYDIEATDGAIGTVSDFLFDDTNWTLRWLVVDNTWLRNRKLLLHPSAIGTIADERRALTVTLSKAQIENSPTIRHDQPVSRQMQLSLDHYFAVTPLWEGGGNFGEGAIASRRGAPPHHGQPPMGSSDGDVLHRDEPDPHLRSVAAVTGYHIHAKDGAIGHVENLIIDGSCWVIQYLVVDTRNFWPGRHVLLSPHAVTEVDWLRLEVRLNLSRESVRASPEWNGTLPMS
jgi:hypothetical protein